MRLRGSNQDITEQRAAEQALAAAAAEREAAARERQIADELQRSLLPAPSFDPDAARRRDLLPAGRRGHAGRRRLVRRDRARRRPHRARGRRRDGPRRARGRRDGAAARRRARVRAARPPARGRARAPRRRRARARRGADRHLRLRRLRPARPARSRTPTPGHLPPLLAEPGAPVRGGSSERRRAAAGQRAADAARSERSCCPSARGSRSTPTGWSSGATGRSTTGIDALAARAGRPRRADRRRSPTRSSARSCPTASDDDVARARRARARGRPRRSPPTLPVAAGRRARCSEARAFVDARAGGVGRARRRSSRDAVLLVSELVTNAILHGRPPIELRLRRDRASTC